jgi:hypothetical protein
MSTEAGQLQIVWALVALYAVTVPAVFVLGGAIFGLVVLAIAVISLAGALFRMRDVERQAQRKLKELGL